MGFISELYNLADKKERFMMAVGILCAMLAGAGIPLNALVLGYAINIFLLSNTNCSKAEWKDIDLGNETVIMCKYGMIVASISMVSGYVSVALWSWNAALFGTKIRKLYFRSLLSQSIGWFDINNTDELVHRFETDVPILLDGCGVKVPFTVQWVVTWLLSYVVAFHQSWKLALSIMFFGPIAVMVNSLVSKNVYKLAIEEYQMYVNSGLSAERVLQKMSIIHSFNAHAWEYNRYTRHLQQPVLVQLRKAMLLGFGNFIPWIINIMAFGVAFGYGNYLVDKEELAPGKVFPVYFGIIFASASVQQIFSNLDAITGAKSSLTPIMEIINQQSPINVLTEEGKRPPEGLQGAIDFRGVFFRFPSKINIKVLNSFDMRVKPGETIGVLGDKSSGIHVIPKLIQRMYDVNKGQIVVDGTDIREYNVSWLRRQMGYVTKDPVLLPVSISENIRHGLDDITQELIEAACRAVNIHEFILGLPRGYDTLVFNDNFSGIVLGNAPPASPTTSEDGDSTPGIRRFKRRIKKHAGGIFRNIQFRSQQTKRAINVFSRTLRKSSLGIENGSGSMSFEFLKRLNSARNLFPVLPEIPSTPNESGANDGKSTAALSQPERAVETVAEEKEGRSSDGYSREPKSGVYPRFHNSQTNVNSETSTSLHGHTSIGMTESSPRRKHTPTEKQRHVNVLWKDPADGTIPKLDHRKSEDKRSMAKRTVSEKMTSGKRPVIEERRMERRFTTEGVSATETQLPHKKTSKVIKWHRTSHSSDAPWKHPGSRHSSADITNADPSPVKDRSDKKGSILWKDFDEDMTKYTKPRRDSGVPDSQDTVRRGSMPQSSNLRQNSVHGVSVMREGSVSKGIPSSHWSILRESRRLQRSSLRVDGLPSSIQNFSGLLSYSRSDAESSQMIDDAIMFSPCLRVQLGIARALVRRPAILMVEDATAVMDRAARAALWRSIAEQRMTTLFFSEHPSHMELTERVVVVSAGRTVKVSSREELGDKTICTTFSKLSDTEIAGARKSISRGSFTVQQRRRNDAVTSLATLAEVLYLKKLEEEDADRGCSPADLDQVQLTEEKQQTRGRHPVIRLLSIQCVDLFYISVGLIISVFLGLAPIGLAWISGQFVTIWYKKCHDLEIQERYGPYALIGILLVFSVFLALMRIAWGYCFFMSSARLASRVRTMMFDAMLKQDLAFFDQEHNSPCLLAHCLTHDPSLLEGVVGNRTGAMVETLTTLCVGVILALVTEWRTTLVIATFGPLSILGSFVQGKVQVLAQRVHARYMATASEIFMEALENMTTITLLSMKKLYIRRLEEILDRDRRHAVKYAHLYGMGQGFMNVLIFVYTAIFVFASYLVRDERIEFQSIFFAFAFMVFGMSDLDISQPRETLVMFYRAKRVAQKIFKVIDSQPVINNLTVDDLTLAPCRGLIAMEKVKFAYPCNPTYNALNVFSMRAEPEMTVALVGPSGCGKSTVLKLLQRSYDIDSGILEVDDLPLRDVSLRWWREQMCALSEDPNLTEGLVRDNITYGDPREDIPLAEIVEAATKADVHLAIENLNEGYDTKLIGDGSGLLSNLERVRLAIARAIFKDPRVLLVDNITACVEPQFTKDVLATVKKVSEGRTTIIATSHLCEIANADQIIMLSHGHVIEKGNHEELMEQKGCYYVLLHKQESKRLEQLRAARKMHKNRSTALRFNLPFGGGRDKVGSVLRSTGGLKKLFS